VANRRITELPAIQGASLAEQDLLTLVRVFEVDPTLKNKRITLNEFSNYLNTKYLTLSGGVLTGPLALDSAAPATATSSGNTGQITWDSGYVYVCVAPNTWKRAQLTSW